VKVVVSTGSRRWPGRILATLLAVATIGCAGPSRESMLDSMVGRDVENALEAFGQPAEVVDLDEGRNLYVWRRVYRDDFDRFAGSWPDRGLGGWDEDPDRPVRLRVCLTSLYVGFDFIVERWEYGCRTEFEDANGWPADPGSLRDPSHRLRPGAP